MAWTRFTVDVNDSAGLVVARVTATLAMPHARPKRTLRLCFLLLLSSCASARWTKPDAAPDDFDQDALRCESEAERTYPQVNQFALAMKAKLVDQCMQQKGWSETN